jgi:hypothetical protein
LPSSSGPLFLLDSGDPSLSQSVNRQSQNEIILQVGFLPQKVKPVPYNIVQSLYGRIYTEALIEYLFYQKSIISQREKDIISNTASTEEGEVKDEKVSYFC